MRARVLRALDRRVGVDVARAGGGDPYMGARQAAVEGSPAATRARRPPRSISWRVRRSRHGAAAAAAPDAPRFASRRGAGGARARLAARPGRRARGARRGPTPPAPAGPEHVRPRHRRSAPEVRLAAARLLRHRARSSAPAASGVRPRQPMPWPPLDAAATCAGSAMIACLSPLDRLAAVVSRDPHRRPPCPRRRPPHHRRPGRRPGDTRPSSAGSGRGDPRRRRLSVAIELNRVDAKNIRNHQSAAGRQRVPLRARSGVRCALAVCFASFASRGSTLHATPVDGATRATDFSWPCPMKRCSTSPGLRGPVRVLGC